MKEFINKFYIPLIGILLVLVFFAPFLFERLLPIASDTIVGLYHPFRDLYASDYPRGIPFKNFLITDPVRQLYPWKKLVIDSFLHYRLPLWNPYEMAEKPLLANFQSSPFYPLNLILFFKPFYFSWSIFIILQMILSVIFLYLYLSNLKLHKAAVLLGIIAWTFSGFVISWLEWGTVIHTALWLPLALLAIDKVVLTNEKITIKNKSLIVWGLVYIFSLTFSFFAGHLQTFFYLFIVSSIYFLLLIFLQKKFQMLFLFLLFNLVFFLLTYIQWFPTLQFIFLSARGSDQLYTSPGFFIPLKQLIMFVAPDFFGNPATLNYWGVWNYAEIIGYVGVVPLIFVMYSLLAKKNLRTVFFAFLTLFALIFSTDNFVARLPFMFHLPFISDAQPTRLLFVITFSLAVLSAYGLDEFLKKENNRVIFSMTAIILLLGVVYSLLWIFVLFFGKGSGLLPVDLDTAKRNLVLPTAIFLFSSAIIIFYKKIPFIRVKQMIIFFLIFVAAIDVIRFADKFDTFSQRDYLFPETSIIAEMQNDPSIFRFVSTQNEIFPPNFNTYYHLQSPQGYDPLYLRRYAEFMAALQRNSPDIQEPFGFNRIITGQNLAQKFLNFLNVKYVLSFNELSEPFILVKTEGRTMLYKNTQVFPRAFFVQNVISSRVKQNEIKDIFMLDLAHEAVVEGNNYTKTFSLGIARIASYEDNRIVVNTRNNGPGFLVLTDVYYPTWKAFIDGKITNIFLTDYAFRGIEVPSGEHIIELKDTLFSL